MSNGPHVRNGDGEPESSEQGHVGIFGVTAGAVCLLAFIVVTALVFSRVTQNADANLALAINGAYVGSIFDRLMVLATDYGREYFWIGIVAVVFLLGRERSRVLALELAILFAAGIFIGEGLKLILFRERPFETIPAIVLRTATDLDSSFPSGHALIVSIGATFALSTLKQRWLAILLAFEAGIVCYSRIYLGAHYPMDVLGGVLIGASIALLGRPVLERYLRQSLLWVARLFARVLGGGLGDA